MVSYPEVVVAQFLERENRFIAWCQLPEQAESERVHVKNTGRCKELLQPNCEVALSYQGSPTRQTAYDLIGVKKGDSWVNIDSQVPNQLAAEALATGDIVLPGLTGTVVEVKREVTYGHSRLDIEVKTSTGEVAVVEVKGMTLEADEIGAFPDAPSQRALKHVQTLVSLEKQGINTYILFIAQLSKIKLGTIHTERQPELRDAFEEAVRIGVTPLVYRCHVTADRITLADEVPFDLDYPFKEKEQEEETC